MKSPAIFKAEQLSIFLENRAGRLSEVIHLLALSGINLRALSLADTSDFGILRIMVCEIAKAEDILKKHGITTGKTPVVVVEMSDVGGSLDAILQLLSANDINVEYMYAFARRNLDKAVMVFRFDKIDEAITILARHGVTLIPASELGNF